MIRDELSPVPHVTVKRPRQPAACFLREHLKWSVSWVLVTAITYITKFSIKPVGDTALPEHLRLRGTVGVKIKRSLPKGVPGLVKTSVPSA